MDETEPVSREPAPAAPRLVRVQMSDIHKRFGATHALCGAELELAAGEVHALLGENGAGKTTLVRVLYGMLAPDAGSIEIDGRPTSLRGPRSALRAGIGLVHQHFMLVPGLKVAENLMLGDPGLGWYSRDRQRRAARAQLEAYGLELDPDADAGDLGVAQQQQLEIVRALLRGVRVLILDEPTAVLAPSETRALLKLLRRLADDGRSVLFISHRLREVSEVADRVTVLRNGRSVATRPVANTDPAELARWMVGRELTPLLMPEPPRADAPVALRVEGLEADGLHAVDLCVVAGEVLALAGIDGNGQGPFEEVIAGVRPVLSGRISLERGPLALLSGDRQRTGLVLDLSVEENLVLPDAAASVVDHEIFPRGVIARGALRDLAQRSLAPFALSGSPDTPARALSGGNQQKVCVARALRGDPQVIVAVNPTRGLDVEAARVVRAALIERARRGVAIVLISTDLDEVLELGMRVLVFFRGSLLSLPRGERSREAIGACMLGQGAE